MPFCRSKKRINKQPGLELSSCSPEEPSKRQHRIDSPKLRSSGRRIRMPNFRRTSAQAIRPGTAQSLRRCSHRTWRSMRHRQRSRSHCPLPARCGRNHFRLGSFSANVRVGPTIQLRHFLPGRKHDVPGPSQWNTRWDRRVLCHRQHPQRITAPDFSRNAKSASTPEARLHPPSPAYSLQNGSYGGKTGGDEIRESYPSVLHVFLARIDV